MATLKRKREESDGDGDGDDISHVLSEQPLTLPQQQDHVDVSSAAYSDSYLSWIPTEVMEDFLPFYVNCDFRMDLLPSSDEVVSAFGRLAALPHSFIFACELQKYLNSICQVENRLVYFFKWFSKWYPYRCFECGVDRPGMILCCARQYHIIFWMPELIEHDDDDNGRVVVTLVYGTPIFIPVCFSCHFDKSDNARAWFTIYWFQHSVYMATNHFNGSNFRSSFRIDGDQITDLGQALNLLDYLKDPYLSVVKNKLFFGLFPLLPIEFRCALGQWKRRI